MWPKNGGSLSNPSKLMSRHARSKMISFRLSAEEYDEFRAFCLTQGIRSFSEMARAAVQKLAQDPSGIHGTTGMHGSGAVESRLCSLEGQVRGIYRELRRISDGDSVSDTGSDSPAFASGSGPS